MYLKQLFWKKLNTRKQNDSEQFYVPTVNNFNVMQYKFLNI